MADVWLDRSGYVPGEKIHFNANIDNYSGKSVRGTTVQFIQANICALLFIELSEIVKDFPPL